MTWAKTSRKVGFDERFNADVPDEPLSAHDEADRQLDPSGLHRGYDLLPGHVKLSSFLSHATRQVIGEAFTLADKAEIDAENVYTLLEDFLPAAP